MTGMSGLCCRWAMAGQAPLQLWLLLADQTGQCRACCSLFIWCLARCLQLVLPVRPGATACTAERQAQERRRA